VKYLKIAAIAAAMTVSLIPQATFAQDNKEYMNPVLGMLDQDKAVFGQFVNYLDVGSDPFSALATLQAASTFSYTIWSTAASISRS
jgi:hypothetical protein